jgi:hypothetical protein
LDISEELLHEKSNPWRIKFSENPYKKISAHSQLLSQRMSIILVIMVCKWLVVLPMIQVDQLVYGSMLSEVEHRKNKQGCEERCGYPKHGMSKCRLKNCQDSLSEKFSSKLVFLSTEEDKMNPYLE